MVQVFLVIFTLLNFGGTVFGSEQPDDKIMITVNVGTLKSNPLLYCDKKYIDSINTEYGITCQYNEPFLPIYDCHSKDKRIINIRFKELIGKGVIDDEKDPEKKAALVKKFDEYLEQLKIDPVRNGIFDTFEQLKCVTHLPFRFFLINSKLAFKQKNERLFSFSREIENKKYLFGVQSTVDFGDCSPNTLFEPFKENPQCTIGGDRLAYVDTAPLEKELLVNGIFAIINGKTVHGPKGYFPSQELESIKKSPSYFSYLKKPFFCLVWLGMLFVIYKKYSRFG